MKPNLYANLNMIPTVGTKKSTPWLNHTQNGFLQHQISSNGPKQSKTIESGQKFQNFSINSEKF